jgi:hypothetical protein
MRIALFCHSLLSEAAACVITDAWEGIAHTYAERAYEVLAWMTEPAAPLARAAS